MIFGVYQIHLGGISRTRTKYVQNTFGGYIRYIWGVYQIHLGGISDTFGGYIRYKNPPQHRIKYDVFWP